MTVSPLAPTTYPALPAIAGVRLASAECGIRYQNRTDLLLVELSEGTSAAGVLTTSLAASASVEACRSSLEKGQGRALIVNSGNSNAFTGKAGEESVLRILNATGKIFHCKPEQVFSSSTGVIGEKLPDDKITSALPALAQRLSADNWEAAARAIMTTDTYPKMATRTAEIGGVAVTINGIAKGSGMIAPDMATMLAYVFTDAAIPRPVLQHLLEQANAKTFNCITVDGDTSTSDTLLCFATSQAGNTPPQFAADKSVAMFAEALHSLLQELALLIVKDGEGAEKLVTIEISGAASDVAARRIGLSIANSPLVKTAIAASDANWGRIVAAVGKAGEKADRDKLVIKIGGVTVAKDGAVSPDYKEEQIASHMQSRDIKIAVDVGIGAGQSTVWTCDLTHRYIDINGSYRS